MKIDLFTKAFLFKLFFVGLISLSNMVLAQLSLSINGKSVESIETVNGYTYVSASTLADVFHADYYENGTDSLIFYLLGHVLQFQVSPPNQATQNSGALRFDGQIKASTSAVRLEESLFVPLRPLIEVLGGNIHYVAEKQKIIAVTPRSELISKRLDLGPTGDRLILGFSLPITYSESYDPLSNELIFHLELSDTQSNWQQTGAYLRNAQVGTDKGELRAKLELGTNTTYTSFVSQEDGQFYLIVDVFPEQNAQPNSFIQLQVDTQNTALQDSLAGLFALRLQENLEAENIASSLSSYATFSPQPETDLLLVIRQADLPSDAFNLYYPQELKADSLLQINSLKQSAPSGLEDVFAAIQTDYDQIATQADRFARSLSSSTGLNLNDFSSAPLSLGEHLPDTVLFLELSASALSDERFLLALAAVLESLLS